MEAGLTIAYVTARKDCRIEWFFDSLRRQVRKEDHFSIIVIDHHLGTEIARWDDFKRKSGCIITHEPPKPNVWNGNYRLTKEDWFAMASSRNTALCLCKTSHICYVDDLSVLMPGWLDAVMGAVEGGYIGCGAYKKVKQLVVENGVPVSYEETAAGTDNRLSLVNEDVAPCDGGWLYGCSVVGPTEAFLSVDGWGEFLCDGMGFEDCLMGIVLKNAGWHLKYLRKMLTLESEELHFVETPMKKSDFGVSPADKSHRALEIAQQSKSFDNGFGNGGIRRLRDAVLSGEPFPIQRNPQHEWFTGTELRDL